MHADSRSCSPLLAALCGLFVVVFAPTDAWAQSDDPCLSSLDAGGVETYEQLVDTYYTAQEDGDFDGQLRALDALSQLCDANLRLGVLRGDALIGLDRCEDAAAEYFRVLDAVPAWPYPDNAADARFMATESLRVIRDQCVAQVEVSCSPASAMVTVAARAPEPCGSVFAVPARDAAITVYADGYETLTRDFTPRAGNNFIDLGPLTPGEGAPPPVTNTTPDPTPVAAGSNEGTLMVSCAPADATVRVEGATLAQPLSLPCPVSTPLPEGAYSLTIEAAGHEPATRDISVRRADVSRMAVELQQPGGDKIGLTLRLFGGVAFASDNTALDDGTTSDEAFRHGNVRLALATPLGGEGIDFEVGAWVRALFPFDDASDVLWTGAATAAYVIPLGVLGVSLAGHLGYGTIGARDEGEFVESGFLYGFGGGLYIPIGASLEVLFNADFLLGTSGDTPFAIDVVGGAGWRF